MTQNPFEESKPEPFSKALVRILVSLGSTSLALILILIFLAFISLPVAALVSVAMAEDIGTVDLMFFISEMTTQLWLPMGFTIFVGCFGIPLILVFVGVFGFPASLIGWKLDLIRKWICIPVGFLLGSVPYTFLEISNRIASHSSSSANGILYWLNGFPTLAGIIQLLIIALIMGVFGAIGGYVFWKTWSFLSLYRMN
jgi:hypothetical protein